VFRSAFALVTASAIVSVASAQATFTPLGVPDGFVDSGAYAVSGDGSTVVGAAGASQQGPSSAWRWTASGGFTLIPNLPGALSGSSRAVSADGNTVVGVGVGPFVPPPGATTLLAFSWTADSGTVNLLPASSHALAYGVSADGTIIAGTDGAQAFRMTPADGLVDLGVPLGAFNSQGYGLSAAKGDINRDGIVNGQDVEAVALHWQQTGRVRVQQRCPSRRRSPSPHSAHSRCWPSTYNGGHERLAASPLSI
jgi:uncharacterized membrane protein